jgi:hypothetical protein
MFYFIVKLLTVQYYEGSDRKWRNREIARVRVIVHSFYYTKN